LLYRLSYGLAARFENISGAAEWVNRREREELMGAMMYHYLAPAQLGHFGASS